MRKVCRERKITVLFSAHELNQLLGAIDRVLYLGNGQAALGTVDEVVTAPVLSRLYGTEIEVRARRRAYLRHVARPRRRTRRHMHDHDHGHDHGQPPPSLTCLHYDFMTNAFAAAGIVAVVSGMVGYFLVMRGQTFAGHALSHVGFAGATGAGLIGLAPLWGLIGFTLAAGIVMGALSERISNRDVAIGVVLSLALGFGLLFLHYYTSFATQATALLFGNVLAVDHAMIATLAVLGAITLAALAVDHAAADLRQPAAGTGRSQRRAAALRLDGLPGHRRAGRVGMRADRRRAAGLHADGRPAGRGATRDHRPVERAVRVGRVCAGEAWLGMTIAYHTDWPVSFCIAVLSALVYFVCLAFRKANGAGESGAGLAERRQRMRAALHLHAFSR